MHNMKILTLIFLFVASLPIYAAEIDLQSNQTGIWSITKTTTHTRWIVIHNLAEAKTTDVYHIEVIARKNNAPTWQIEHLANHLAITAAALSKSVIAPLSKGAVYPETFDNAYRTWQNQSEGKGGAICTTSVTECLSK